MTSDENGVPPRQHESSYVSPLPDPERISSVETVRAYLEQHEADVEEEVAWRLVQSSAQGSAASGTAKAAPRRDVPSVPPPQRRQDPSELAQDRKLETDVAAAPAVNSNGPPEPRPPTDRAATTVWEGAPVALSPHPSQRDVPISSRYALLDRIAAGGMAEIYRVRHLALGKVFALKLIHYDDTTAAARMRQLFFREARLVSRMDHPNIVSVTDFGVDPKLGAYIVMEYLKGETLHRRLVRQRRLRLHTALEIALQVAEALHYMHGQSVIHCDVKAENVFLCHSGGPAASRSRIQVKLIDFGLSRPRTTGVMLARDEVGGTPQYMPPELIRGHAPQPSMDIYALGVLLYEMITGVVPIEGTTPSDTIQAQLEQEPLPPSAVLGEPLESRVEALILQALCKDPADRQPSMGHVIFQLRTVMQMYGLRSPRHQQSTPTDRPAIVRIRPFQQIVSSCPFPLFQLDPLGRLTVVNRAFCRFVRARETDLLGQPIGETRLAMVYPSVQSDAEACGRQTDRVPLRRAFAFTLQDGSRKELLCWLRPELSQDGRVVAVNGYIHQLV